MLKSADLCVVLVLLLLAGCVENQAPVSGSGPPQELSPLTITSGDGSGGRENAVQFNIRPPEQRRQALEPGDASPALSVSRWMKGEPTELAPGDTVYVVEFWATWCGPCLMSMPHIAELQTKYGDKVRFIGVTDEEPELVAEFLKKPAQGGQQTWEQLLTYRIAVDDGGRMNSEWMQAAGQEGIPCAFIVGRKGQVEWVGHPLTIDKPLQQVVEGTWDIQKGKLEAEQRQAASEALASANFSRLLSIAEQMDQGDAEAASLRILALFQLKRPEEGNAAAAALLAQLQDNSQDLNALAWMLAVEVTRGDVDLQLALRAAERAVELDGGTNANSLDTLARVHFCLGNAAKAAEVQQRAISQADASQKSGFEVVLREYESAGSAGQRSGE